MQFFFSLIVMQFCVFLPCSPLLLLLASQQQGGGRQLFFKIKIITLARQAVVATDSQEVLAAVAGRCVDA
jgi:hypothetical protein